MTHQKMNPEHRFRGHRCRPPICCQAWWVSQKHERRRARMVTASLRQKVAASRDEVTSRPNSDSTDGSLERRSCI